MCAIVLNARGSFSKICRIFHFQDSYDSDDDDDAKEDSVKLIVKVFEEPDAKYGMYVWFAAPVLAQYVWFNRAFVENKKILEIGAGTGLPGIVASKCGAQVTFSDSEFHRPCLDLCHYNMKMNELRDVNILGITWGLFTTGIVELENMDLILASDCFYDPKDFEDILVTVSFVLNKNPSGSFWCSYQERSSDWTIEPLLLKWNLTCTYIPLESFGADGPNIAGSKFPGPHTIHMLDIKLKK